MRLILHIGSGKTGTTTLQSTLCAHAQTLLQSGILYPTPLFNKVNHNYLSALVHPMQDMPREFTSGGTLLHEEIRARGVAFWEDIKRQVDASGAETVVLSGEYFFGLSQAKLDRLKSLLSEAFSDVRIVAYVRHPATFYVSWMQQLVKASHEIRPPGAFAFQAKASLTRYAESFDGRVTVRSSHRETLLRGSIVHDFLTMHLDIDDVLARTITVTDVNESMSGEAMCIMQRLRRHGWPEENGHFSPVSTHVEDTLHRIRDRSRQVPARLKPDIHAAMTLRHQGYLEWLASEHGIHFEGHDLPATTSVVAEPDGWMSNDLQDILAVDDASLEQSMFLLIQALASSSLRQ